MMQLMNTVGRLFLAGAILLGVIAVWEKAANLMDLTLVRGLASPSRILELAAVAVVFAIALELLGIKNALERRS